MLVWKEQDWQETLSLTQLSAVKMKVMYMDMLNEQTGRQEYCTLWICLVELDVIVAELDYPDVFKFWDT